MLHCKCLQLWQSLVTIMTILNDYNDVQTYIDSQPILTWWIKDLRPRKAVPRAALDYVRQLKIPKFHWNWWMMKLVGGPTNLGPILENKLFQIWIKMLESLTKIVFLEKKLMWFKFELISAILRPWNSLLKIRFLCFLRGFHKFLHSSILMKL